MNPSHNNFPQMFNNNFNLNKSEKLIGVNAAVAPCGGQFLLKEIAVRHVFT